MKHELILCIVNTGFTDVVMDAARDKGARGGTVIHARGTANKEAEEFFGISIQPDKEIVMILVPSEIKNDVLHAVYQAAGLKTAGQGIAFALPVTNVVGISDNPATLVTASQQSGETEKAATEQESNEKTEEDQNN